MRVMKFPLPAAVLVMMGLGVAAAPPSEQPAENAPTARTIKYADLSKFIRAQRGKVILVDFWSVY